ncbi:WxL domain-containing protein [Alkalihalobacillus sp. LMS6]|uniref:lectin-like domain-containing protein n=1 Tax=Alkalihalobacillus sp. LMS6 TaxID=2924034 RepID=UPI0020D18B4F|nr:WxL domain-containing protein [Alkalihalobacillus sp. LMS6]UTR08241.1 WxL domain-containing protein [Alkalihalobacillus sp. LMS6]
MHNLDLNSRQLIHQRYLCIVLSCLLIISSIPLQEIAVDAEEEAKQRPTPLSLKNDDRISQDYLIEIELDPSLAEDESRWVLTLPGGLIWVNEEDDEHLEYIAEKSELHSKALTETQSFVFQIEHPGTYTIPVSSFNLDEEEIIYEAFVFERAQPEAPPIEADEEVEEVEETEPDEIVEEEKEIDNIEPDESTEPDPIVPAPDPSEQIAEEAPESSPIIEEEDQKETVAENDEEKQAEAPPEEQKPVEENTTSDDVETLVHEETFPSFVEEDPDSDLEQQVEEVKNRFTTSAIEVSNVNTIPNPPVSGPNVGELFTFAGDQNVAQHRSSNVRVLADGTRNKSSAMWFNEQVDLNQSFQTSMFLYINGATPNQTQIADGLTFTMHGDGRGLQAIGQNGESLGAYGTIRNSSYRGYIERALSFEFDTYHNGDFSDRGMRNQSHTAVVGPNVTDTTGTWPWPWRPQNPRMVHSDITYRQIISNSWQPFTVQWEKGSRNSGTLSYTFAGQTTRYEVRDYQSLFGSNRVHWGFTGATGQEVGMYAIAYADLPQRPRAQKTVRNVTTGETRFQEQSTAYPGDILEYELTLENPAENGLGAVWPNVQVTDPLPNGLTYVANGSRDKPSRINGQQLTFNRGDFGVGQSKTVRFRVQVDDRASGSLINQAYATATSGAFQGQVSTNESTITLNKIGIEADAVPQTFSVGTDPTTWKATDFVKNIRIKPDLLNQSVRVVGFAGAFPDVSKPGVYSVGVKMESTIYSNVTQIIQVPVTIVDGALSLVVPDLDFGTQTISSRHERYFGEADNGELIITDTRYVKNRWSLTVQQQQPFRDKNSGTELSANLFYIDNDSQQLINEHAAVIASGKITSGSTDIISRRWQNDKNSKIGFFLDVPAGTGNVNRSYETEITWTLQDVPANE